MQSSFNISLIISSIFFIVSLMASVIQRKALWKSLLKSIFASGSLFLISFLFFFYFFGVIREMRKKEEEEKERELLEEAEKRKKKAEARVNMVNQFNSNFKNNKEEMIKKMGFDEEDINDEAHDVGFREIIKEDDDNKDDEETYKFNDVNAQDDIRKWEFQKID